MKNAVVLASLRLSASVPAYGKPNAVPPATGNASQPDGKALAKGRARAVIRAGGMQPPSRMFMVS